MAAFLLPLALSHTVASANALIEDHTSLLSGVYLSQNMQITINATSFQVNGVKAKLNRDGSYSAERMSDLLGEGSFVILSPEKLEYTSADGTTAFEHSFGLTPDTETELADKRLLQWVEGELNTKASGISKSSAPDFAAFDRIIASAPNPDALKYYFSRHKASLLFFDELRRNTEEEEVDVRRTNMDRLSAIFQHVHVSTLPRLHWGMLARYASSKVETEGSGNGDNSFGNFLHVNGEQVMESWETAWMRKLAKFGLSKTKSAQPGAKVNVLELGWGQGISGRQLLAQPNVNYTVIELHPTVAANARSVFKKLGADARVLQGSWEEVLPKVASNQFDVIFSDTWDTTRANGRQKYEFNEPWDINAYDSQIWSLYRVLKPQGAFVYYATGREYQGLAQFNVWWEPNIFAEFSISKLSGLKPYKGTTYVGENFDETVLPCGLK